MLLPHLKALKHNATRTLRKEVKKNRVRLKLPLSDYCPLPDFLVIGVMKSGTSSLYHNMCKHPNIAPAIVKEVLYFDSQYHKQSVEWYKAHFPLLLSKQGGRPRLTGEASPNYILYPNVAKRIYALVPDVRLIAVLRNPVDRAFSHYNHKLKNGKETRSFAEVVDFALRQENILQEEYQKMLEDDRYFSKLFFDNNYLIKGTYAVQLTTYLKYFCSKQLLVIKSEDFYADPNNILNGVFNFLGLPDYTLRAPKKHMTGRYTSQIDSGVRTLLEQYFKPHNEQLYEFVGANWGWE